MARAYRVLLPIIGLSCRATVYIGRDGRILLVDRPIDPVAAGVTMVRRLEQFGAAVSERFSASPPQTTGL